MQVLESHMSVLPVGIQISKSVNWGEGILNPHQIYNFQNILEGIGPVTVYRNTITATKRIIQALPTKNT